MGIYSLLDDQTWSYIIFFVAVIGLVLYGMSTFFIIISQIGGRFILYKKEDPMTLTDNVPGVSIIKPLMGIDPLLEVNLESHFTLSYPKLEILCCVQDDQDPAINVVNKMKERYPKVDCKLFIGGKDDIINPMVNNMAPAYDNAQYEYIWISTSRIKANTQILLDMVCKLQKPNVALCHQMPFTTDHKGFAQALEKTYFGGAFARYYLAFNVLGLCCATGMSYMVKKVLLDEVHGLNWYGKYLAEDFFLTYALHEKGYRLVLSAYPAQQNLAQTEVMGYKNRMVRWLRLRLNMIPLVSGFFEPLTECIPIGIYAAWSLYHFLGINPYIFFSIHIVAWLVSDYLLLRMVQVGHSMLNLQTPNKNQGCLFYYKQGSPPFSKIQYLFAWILREILAVWVFFEALVSPRTIKWGKRTYKLSLGGHTEIVSDTSKAEL
ncbi:ceramide glucosyltransferase-like isoform X1 [Ruditapes philippinarum]|uniref:ceramide glucosyltransferase-like isoform X1 n=1 Tax=Ruditapes philippinarum TaxID=129788 RepID=UPI00295A90CC|nr:ceramide glucosyltransferase-like isoform X1 [Ruditapes philippinarum]XP_060601494.1 ceramide glucosyltransferase-like isoform X1 [Ruditapes philippinarum]XP_060601501.1 ceramide glucosyltransferase-like isoform X1 [Ruditapes philippinarum]XP_060601508.1 ceramide glucosyltransferase-like isoform X1 [Ruditapes philippinarum]XP_060601514.1 ceramide glucosyltransferase-like isoform X1 [Ruditapes philippinarum]